MGLVARSTPRCCALPNPAGRWSAVRAEVARDLSRSAAAFRDIVWPEIKQWCRGGEIIPVESVTESGFASALDQLAGIDAWQAVEDIGMRGIASRVQWVAKPYRSFTIRETRT